MQVPKAPQITFLLLVVLLTVQVQDINCQRVAPGVPPQHYEHPQYQQQQQHHPPPPQQYQQQQQQARVVPGVAPQHYQAPQQQVQYQQVPVQQQQPIQQQQQPIQQQQQQQQYQQQPIPQGQPPQAHQHQQQQHGGHHQPNPGQTQQVLNAANIEHERVHIQEHMQVPIDTSKMSEAELQFHYFKMHDSDNNNKLDGCELIKSLIHWHVDDHSNPQPKTSDTEGTGEKNGVIYNDKSLADVIDYVLNTMDLNNDGFVDYTEYRKSEEANAVGKN